jgi:hypothetical protein
MLNALPILNTLNKKGRCPSAALGYLEMIDLDRYFSGSEARISESGREEEVW